MLENEGISNMNITWLQLSNDELRIFSVTDLPREQDPPNYLN